MKKIVSLFTVLFIALTIGNAASAQSIMAHTLTTADVEHVIVKSYNYPVTITSCNFKNTDVPSSVFIYSGANHKSLQVRLDSFVVNDFAIDNDTVFFCGQSWKGKGIIGFFNIQDLFFNSGSFRVQDEFDVYDGIITNRPVEKLIKMVTYRMTGQKRHIVSIGYAQDVFQDGYHYSCIVDMYLDQRRPVSPWYYNSGTIHSSDSNYFKDITLAGNYVVTAGFEIDQYISMRLFKANDLFSTTGPQNTARVFYNGNNKWKKQDLLLATVSNGALPAVATAAIRDISYSATYKPIHIATYDVSMLATGSSSSMTGSAVMNVGWYDSVRRLYDFIADPINEKFALLHLGENASSQICCIFPKINYNLQSFARSKL